VGGEQSRDKDVSVGKVGEIVSKGWMVSVYVLTISNINNKTWARIGTMKLRRNKSLEKTIFRHAL